ncbi:hypothetical protein [Nocardia sp. NPDC127526]|uniref:hypothetical protein n=1 Tax=Nocardia sp. NPDC127526 TaxID=3345393 RepID=UPI00363BD993
MIGTTHENPDTADGFAELEAMRTAYLALKPLDDVQRERAARWLAAALCDSPIPPAAQPLVVHIPAHHWTATDQRKR